MNGKPSPVLPGTMTTGAPSPVSVIRTLILRQPEHVRRQIRLLAAAPLRWRPTWPGPAIVRCSSRSRLYTACRFHGVVLGFAQHSTGVEQGVLTDATGRAGQPKRGKGGRARVAPRPACWRDGRDGVRAVGYAAAGAVSSGKSRSARSDSARWAASAWVGRSLAGPHW
jgi:hypothetical protein